MQNATLKVYQTNIYAFVLCIVLICSLSLSSMSAQARPASTQRQAVQQAAGKVIVVNLSHQWLYAYENGTQVFSTAVLTGRPDLPTPKGTYHVFSKLSPTTFYSPFPKGSANWYPPTHINYALEFLSGYFLHDSWWHTTYGPGTNKWHKDPKYGWQTGSHGCVSMPLNSAAWLYKWAPIGTVVRITA